MVSISGYILIMIWLYHYNMIGKQPNLLRGKGEMPQDYLLRQRLNRILQAVALEKPDRTPVVLQYSGFAAYVTGTPMAEYLSTPLKATETMIKAYELAGDGDAINYGSFSPYGLCHLFGSKARFLKRRLTGACLNTNILEVVGKCADADFSTASQAIKGGYNVRNV
jgi:hypothetical protein